MIHLGRIGAIIVLLLIPIFGLMDFFVFSIPRLFILFRLPPFLFAVIFLVLVKSALVKNHMLVQAAYMLLLLSSLLMINGLIVITAGSEYYDAAVLWLVIVIFLVFLGYRGKVMVLVLLLSVPLVLLAIHILLNVDIAAPRAVFMAMPYVVSGICIALAVSQNRMRHNRFRQAAIIEAQTRELEENYRSIEKKNNQIFNDLRLARSIQINLIPQEPPVVDGAEFYSSFIPLAELGGDFYDFIRFGEANRIGVFISDVSGHGVAAALISSMVKTLVHTAGQEKYSCSEFMACINDTMIGLTKNKFITAFYGIYDTGTGKFSYARGGHPYPYLLRADGSVEELRSDGVLLGVRKGVTFAEGTVELNKGDRILLYTDGLMEARNSRHEEFEHTLMNDIIMKHRDRPISELVQSIIQGLFEFCGTQTINDDVCIVMMEAK
ncbi:MAG TPA: PP2C family protein-serine/threonine phosphatase [Spirochaetota bacterium]|nr:PP2C family protein-serine/threonine phosphatase [Spirochaetota bacterium]HPV39778.1 PP2C family protein-serine/threonine phosphatase [Spirochaetota bacterium]